MAAVYSPLAGSQLHGKVVVIRRSGDDGSIFPLTMRDCVLGRGETCSIRIQLPSVSDQQCSIEVLVDGAVQITNLSRSHPTRVNDKPVNGKAILRHKDMIAIADRHFRFEYPDNHPLAVDELILKAKSPSRSKSLSPRKSVTPGRPSLKSARVLTPRRKPPQPERSNDVENTSPETLSRRGSTGRRSGTHTPYKILTPSRKPPTPKSPLAPGSRRSADLRKSVTELKRRSAAIEETPELEPSPKKRRSSSGASTAITRSRKVSFGANLSPELFDKTLPPGTPIRRGSVPKRVSMGASETGSVASPRILKRRSVAALPSTKPITEESPAKYPGRSPKQTDKKSPKSPKAQSSDTSQLKSALHHEDSMQGRSSRRSRHVVVKSPHVPHHEMSEQEIMKDAMIKKQEGITFKRLSHSPDMLSPPATPPSLKHISDSASPALKRSATKGRTAPNVAVSASTPGKSPVFASPARASLARASPARASPAQGTLALHSPARTSPARASPARGTPTRASPARGSPARGTPIRGSPARGTPIRASPARVAPSKGSPKLVTPKPAAPLTSASKRAARTIMTPKMGHVVHTDTPRPKTPQSQSRDDYIEPKIKIPSPPMDIKKAVALRAIHGRSATPGLPAGLRQQLSPKVGTPSRKAVTPTATSQKARTPRSSAKKTAAPRSTIVKSWADVVKTGKRKSLGKMGKARRAQITKQAVPKKPAATKRKASSSVKVPKTPRPIGAAQSTGHVDSPVTIILRKGRARSTPAPDTPKLNESGYDELPATPASPPTVMFISPLSEQRGRARKSPLSKVTKKFTSPSLIGVKETLTEKPPRKSVDLRALKALMKSPVVSRTPQLTGVKEIFAVPKGRRSVSLVGVKETFAIAKPHRNVRLTGVKELMTQQNIKRKSVNYTGLKELTREPKRRRSVQLSGIKNMMSASQKRKSTNLEGLDVLFTEVMPPSSKKAKVDVESPVKTARGRRVAAKPATPKTAAVKATRGRKAVRLEEAASPVETSPVKATRGRRAKATVAAASPAKKTRGRKAAAKHSTPKATPVKATRGRKAAPAKKADSPVEATPVKTTRGRRATGTVAEMSPIKKTRGRKAATKPTTPKKASVEVVISPVEAMPVKAERGRRAKGPVADKSPAKKTRGRKAATKSATPDPTPVIETMSPVEPTPVKSVRGRRATVPDKSPVKKTRGRKAATKPAIKPIEPVEGIPVKATRGRRPKTTVAATSPAKKTSSREAAAKPSTPKSTRGRKAASAKKANSPVPTKAGKDRTAASKKITPKASTAARRGTRSRK